MLSMILAIALQASPEAPPAAPAAAPAAEASKAAATPTKSASKPKRVCINDAAPGSKIPTRRCMDQDEYLRYQQDAKERLDAIQRASTAPRS